MSEELVINEPKNELEATEELDKISMKEYQKFLENKKKREQRKEKQKIVKTIKQLTQEEKDQILHKLLDNDDGQLNSYTKLHKAVQFAKNDKLISRNDCKVFFTNYKKEKLFNKQIIPNNFNEHISKQFTEHLGNFKQEFKKEFISEFEDVINNFKKDFNLKQKKEPIKQVIQEPIQQPVQQPIPQRRQFNFTLGRLPKIN